MRVITVIILHYHDLHVRQNPRTTKQPPKVDWVTKSISRPTTTVHIPQLHSKPALLDYNWNLVPTLPSAHTVRGGDASSQESPRLGAAQAVSRSQEPPCSGASIPRPPRVVSIYPASHQRKLLHHDRSYQNATAPTASEQAPIIPTPTQTDSPLETSPPECLPLPSIILTCRNCGRSHIQLVEECTKCYCRYFYSSREYQRMLVREEQAKERETIKLKRWQAILYMLFVCWKGGFS